MLKFNFFSFILISLISQLLSFSFREPPTEPLPECNIVHIPEKYLGTGVDCMERMREMARRESMKKVHSQLQFVQACLTTKGDISPACCELGLEFPFCRAHCEVVHRWLDVSICVAKNCCKTCEVTGKCMSVEEYHAAKLTEYSPGAHNLNYHTFSQVAKERNLEEFPILTSSV